MKIVAMKYSRNMLQGRLGQQELAPTSVSRQQEQRAFKRSFVHIPKLRHPILGYLLSFPLVGLALYIGLLGEWLLPHFFFFNAPLFLTVMVVALLWGARPALLAVLLCTLVLDYFVLPLLLSFLSNKVQHQHALSDSSQLSFSVISCS